MKYLHTDIYIFPLKNNGNYTTLHNYFCTFFSDGLKKLTTEPTENFKNTRSSTPP